jgi:hypothetical protein
LALLPFLFGWRSERCVGLSAEWAHRCKRARHQWRHSWKKQKKIRLCTHIYYVIKCTVPKTCRCRKATFYRMKLFIIYCKISACNIHLMKNSTVLDTCFLLSEIFGTVYVS